MPAAELTNDALPPNEGVYEVDEDGGQRAYIVVKRQLPNPRIDKYLRHRFPDFSRSMIQGLIKEEAITVNDRPTKASYNLKAGDRVDLVLPPPPTTEIAPEHIPLDILYEDEHMIVLNKQANLIVHPARGNRGGTLVNGLVWYSDSLSSVNSAFRPGIVHRLDRNTTGVLVVAKTDTAHWRLALQFEHRQTKKEYVAIVHGTVGLDADVIDAPLGRHPVIREKYAIRPETGKEAVTTYEVAKQYRGYALVRLMPRTGRTHQLRVHMSYIKHPIVADTMYGGKVMTLGQLADGAALPAAEECDGLTADAVVIDRQALHARRLTLRHPASSEIMTFEAPLPRDMALLQELLERYRGQE